MRGPRRRRPRRPGRGRAPALHGCLPSDRRHLGSRPAWRRGHGDPHLHPARRCAVGQPRRVLDGRRRRRPRVHCDASAQQHQVHERRTVRRGLRHRPGAPLHLCRGHLHRRGFAHAVPQGHERHPVQVRGPGGAPPPRVAYGRETSVGRNGPGSRPGANRRRPLSAQDARLPHVRRGRPLCAHGSRAGGARWTRRRVCVEREAAVAGAVALRPRLGLQGRRRPAALPRLRPHERGRYVCPGRLRFWRGALRQAPA